MTTIERDTTGKINAIAGYSATLVFIAACLVATFSLYLTAILQWHGPFRDLWEFVPAIEQQLNGIWSLSYLTDAYGGAHRIFFPKLLFFADWQWFGGKNNLTLAVAIACQCIYLAIISSHFAKDAVLHKHEKRLLTGAFLLTLFSTTQVNNFLYAMDVQWFMSNLLALLALTILISHKQPVTAFLLVGTAAAMCNFTGLMSLVVGSLWLVSQRPVNRKSLLAVLTAFALVLAYIHNPKNAEHVTVVALQQANDATAFATIIAGSLLKMAIYLLRYLASPLSREWPWAGAICSTSVILIIVHYWKQCLSRTLSTGQQLCLLIASYILLSGIATAFGRAIYPNSAVAERYQTLVLPLLPAVIGLVLPDLQSAWRLRLAPLCIGLIIGFHLLPAQLTSAREMAILSNRVNLAHTAARAGVLERPYIGATLSHPLLINNINMVKITDPFLRSQQLGYFRAFQDIRLGHPWQYVSLPLPVCSSEILPELDQAYGVWILQGPLLDDARAVTDIVLSQQATVVGMGVWIRPEGNLLPHNWIASDERRFRAFALSSNLLTNQPLLISGLANGNVICQQSLHLL